MEALLVLVIVAALLALGYAAFNFIGIKKMDEGTDRMSEIAAAIRVGANAFITYEYKIIAVVVVIVAVVFGVIFSIQYGNFSWQPSVCFIIGVVMSAAAGWVGMKIATYANVRVSNRARETKDIGKTLKVALKGGSVMGLCVGGFALLGLFLVYLIFGYGLGLINEESLILGDHLFTQCLSCYALGCSIVAMFNRVGGGIYTKAADMGADLVGKTEAHIPEDDPRNPATIADNVGDNVGDVAGLGSDLLESFVGAVSSAIILAVSLALHAAVDAQIPYDILSKMMYFPLVFASVGLIASILGIAFVLIKKGSDNPHRDLNISTWSAAAITIIGGFVATYVMFNGLSDYSSIGFNIGFISPWIAASLGVISGVVIGGIAEYYTSYDYKPTQGIAQASKEGAALTITQGLAVGMKSCMYPLIVLGITTYASYAVSGMFGIAMAAVGMLSFVSATVSVDTYGPISDNAGGIAEMSELEPEVREITDKLDSVGNTTAAIGKGFAIGSASLAALSLMVSFLYAFQDGSVLDLNFTNPLILAGALVGGALPFLFSGMLIEAVANAARKMVEEVRRQFREIPGILEGKAKPDYKTCIEISSQGALKEMKVPAILAILFPLVSGFLFGPWFVGGLLIGATLSAIMLAIFTGNAGGAWDNGKKYIESGAIEGQGKGSPAHDAAVVGDTVGDPLKDTVGPSLDILIKIMSTVSLVAAVLFSQYNLIDWITTLIK
ncbi:MAG: sodium-translocating pyrophosphatase [Lachnospira sp.]